MSASKEKTQPASELRIKGSLARKGVRVVQKQSVDELSSKGYGVAEENGLLLTFYEALYLLDKGIIAIEDEKGSEVNFQKLVQCYEKINENAWAGYLVYRDLRSRGYVAREGFGSGIDFRVYDRGDFSKGAAKYLILSIQEGKPVSIGDLTNAMTQSLSLKKELVLAVVNRRGETVYYSVSELTLK